MCGDIQTASHILNQCTMQHINTSDEDLTEYLCKFHFKSIHWHSFPLNTVFTKEKPTGCLMSCGMNIILLSCFSGANSISTSGTFCKSASGTLTTGPAKR